MPSFIPTQPDILAPPTAVNYLHTMRTDDWWKLQSDSTIQRWQWQLWTRRSNQTAFMYFVWLIYCEISCTCTIYTTQMELHLQSSHAIKHVTNERHTVLQTIPTEHDDINTWMSFTNNEWYTSRNACKIRKVKKVAQLFQPPSCD